MNGLLLDTHVVLWLLDDNPRLGRQARSLIAGNAVVYLSAASIWELAIKAAIGKVTLPGGFDDFSEAIEISALRDLAVTRRHTLASDITALPHKDPFDAVLVAQATVEQLTLMTADAKLLTALPNAVDARI